MASGNILSFHSTYERDGACLDLYLHTSVLMHIIVSEGCLNVDI